MVGWALPTILSSRCPRRWAEPDPTARRWAEPTLRCEPSLEQRIDRRLLRNHRAGKQVRRHILRFPQADELLAKLPRSRELNIADLNGVIAGVLRRDLRDLFA